MGEFGKFTSRMRPADLGSALKASVAAADASTYARLVAAVPEMYAALIAAREKIERMAKDDLHVGWTDVIDQINAALAKAEGREP